MMYPERVAVLERVRDDQGGTQNKTVKREQVVEALKDIRTWLIVLTTMLSTSSYVRRSALTDIVSAASIPNGALSNCMSSALRVCRGSPSSYASQSATSSSRDSVIRKHLGTPRGVCNLIVVEIQTSPHLGHAWWSCCCCDHAFLWMVLRQEGAQCPSSTIEMVRSSDKTPLE
jgi:hypothetical protein